MVTGLPKKTRMTAAELAEILEPIAYPPIGRPLHIEPRARGTAYLDFGDAQTADHVAEQLDQARLPEKYGAGKIEAKRQKGGDCDTEWYLEKRCNGRICGKCTKDKKWICKECR